jgi:hypothetical protein
MNGQPPPPSSIPPAQPAPYYPPPRSGMGCFAKGCLAVLIIGGLFIFAVIGTGWYVVHKLASNNLISDSPTLVQVEPPTEAQYQTAESSFNRMKEAAAAKREETVSFTASDLNALLAKNPDFRNLAGHARVEIADSIMTVSLSAPVNRLWSSRKERWFNGTVRFTGSYEDGDFQVSILSARGGEYEVPGYILSRINSKIDESMVEVFDELRGEDTDIDLRRVKRMVIDGDKLVVTTKPN